MIQDKKALIGIDTDTADEAIDPAFARRIENCRVNIVNGGKDGIVEPVMGNLEVINTIDGYNKTIGCYSDAVHDKIYFFNHGYKISGTTTIANDAIYCLSNDTITTIISGDLGWDDDTDLHSICLINNLLSWTEGVEKYPREIDVNSNYDNFTEFDISLIKTPPTFPLVIKSQSKDLVIQNFYKKNNYYFIYRFVYDNGQCSSWSPQSKLVSSLYSDFQPDDWTSCKFAFNDLRIFREGGTDGLQYNKRIKHIDFAYANTYLGPFKFFKRTPVFGLTTSGQWDTLLVDSDISLENPNKTINVTFKNDISFSVLDATDTSRPYDEIWPADTICQADNRNIIGSTKEGISPGNIQFGNITQGFSPNPAITTGAGLFGSGQTAAPIVYAELIGNFMVWKNYSKYGIGLVFYNEFGQKSGVYTASEMKVLIPADYRQAPFQNTWAFNFDVSGTPPIEATHFQVVRTNNQKTTRFAQGLLNNALYVSSYNDDGTPNVIPKILGTSLPREKVDATFGVPGLAGGGLPGWKVFDTVYSQTDDTDNSYPYPNLIYENGLDGEGRFLTRRQANTNKLGDVAQGQNHPTQSTSSPGFPDSRPFDFEQERLYIIGSTDGTTDFSKLNAYNTIYIGGTNRRGEKLTKYYKNNLQSSVDILIDIYNWNNPTTFEQNELNGGPATGVVAQLFNPSNETPYEFEKGDLLNVYYDGNGNYIDILDIEIKDFIQGRYLKIKFDQRFLDNDILGPGSLIEIFTPNTGSDDIIYYEYGDVYPIINAKTANASLSKTSFSIFEGDTHYMAYADLYATNYRVNYRDPNTIPFHTGQGYFRYAFFSMTPDNLNRFGIWEKANGRPNVVLLDGERVTYKKNTIRYSDRYIDGATINGTSTFYSFNQLQLDYDWGGITKLTSQEQVLLANCTQEAVLVYVNKSMITNASGNDSLIISDQVLNSPKKMVGGYGCINPESVSQYNEYIYFYSKKKGCVLRYNIFSGIFDIAGGYKARSYFFNKISNKCQSGFDPIYRTQYFCFDDENIGFIDPKGPETPNTWAGFFGFIPEKLGYVQLQMYTFKNGKPWKHEVGSVNTFYGTTYPSKIQVIFNANPNEQKIANSIRLESDKPLLCELITNQEGQTTTIDYFEQINKDWCADVPGDNRFSSKWEGELMSSHVFDVTFRYDPAFNMDTFRLRYLNLYSQTSQRTNK